MESKFEPLELLLLASTACQICGSVGDSPNPDGLLVASCRPPTSETFPSQGRITRSLPSDLPQPPANPQNTTAASPSARQRYYKWSGHEFEHTGDTLLDVGYFNVNAAVAEHVRSTSGPAEPVLGLNLQVRKSAAEQHCVGHEHLHE